MKSTAGRARVGRPTSKHTTIWVNYTGPKTPENSRGRYWENTGLPWTEDHASRDWKTAEKIARQKAREYENDQDGIKPQVMPSRKRLREWAEEHEAQIRLHAKPAWALRAGYCLARVNEVFGDRRPDEITLPRIEAYQAVRIAKGISAKTLKDEVTLLLATLRRVEEAGNLSRVPRVKHLKSKAQLKPKETRVYVETPRLEKVFENLRQSFPAFADFAEAFFLCGLRPAALGRLLVDHVTRVGLRDEIHVPAALMKDDEREHRIPVIGDLATIVTRRLADQASSGLLFHDGEGRSLVACATRLGLADRPLLAWRKACKAAGLEGLTFYTLRACFETRAGKGGATDVQIKAAMAHANGETDTYMLASLMGEAMEAAAKVAEQERRSLVQFPAIAAVK